VTNLHPQTDLTASCTTSYPILAPMEDRNGRDGGNGVAPKLRQLITGTTIYVDKAIHVSDAESLYMRLGVQLPLRAKTAIYLVQALSWEILDLD
jgi:hypothetical protein